MTQRKEEIKKYLNAGLTPDKIAEALGISIHCVKSYVNLLKSKGEIKVKIIDETEGKC